MCVLLFVCVCAEWTEAANTETSQAESPFIIHQHTHAQPGVNVCVWERECVCVCVFSTTYSQVYMIPIGVGRLFSKQQSVAANVKVTSITFVLVVTSRVWFCLFKSQTSPESHRYVYGLFGRSANPSSSRSHRSDTELNVAWLQHDEFIVRQNMMLITFTFVSVTSNEMLLCNDFIVTSSC